MLPLHLIQISPLTTGWVLIFIIQNTFSNISPAQGQSIIASLLSKASLKQLGYQATAMLTGLSSCESVKLLLAKIYIADALSCGTLKPAGDKTEVWVTMYRNVSCSINTFNIVWFILILCLLNKGLCRWPVPGRYAQARMKTWPG